MSSPLTLPTPSTPLPNDPSSLSKYIRQQHLSALRTLYEHKTIEHAKEQEVEAIKRREKRLAGMNAPEHEAGAAAAAHAITAEETTGRDTNTFKKRTSGETLEHDIALLHQALHLPATTGSSTSAPGIDSIGHSYDFLFDLSPNGSSDAYYHGPHPAPPAKIIRSLLRASRQPPLFDPHGLSSTQLLPRAQHLFDALLSAAPEIDQVETDLIAAFSASCDERIGESLARMDQLDREVALQRRDDERYAIALAAATAAAAASTGGAGVGTPAIQPNSTAVGASDYTWR